MLPDRFLDKISPEPNTGCWLWTAATNNQGYGVLTHTTDKKRVVLAHRFAFKSERGEIPEDRELDHLCRTPLCVNPSHLEPKTHGGNMQNSRSALKEFCANGHERTPENTYIRKDRSGSKQCRVCSVEANRQRYRPTGNPQNTRKTHCKRGHAFTPENTRWIRNHTARQCRACEVRVKENPHG